MKAAAMGGYTNSSQKHARTDRPASGTTGSLTSGHDTRQGWALIWGLSPFSAAGRDTLQRPLQTSVYDLEERMNESGEGKTAHSQSLWMDIRIFSATVAGTCRQSCRG